MLYYLGWGQVEQVAAVVQAYWRKHYYGVAAVTADKAEGIVEEGTVDEETFDVEAIQEVGYGKSSSLDESSSIQETNNFVGLVAVSKGSRS